MDIEDFRGPSHSSRNTKEIYGNVTGVSPTPTGVRATPGKPYLEEVLSQVVGICAAGPAQQAVCRTPEPGGGPLVPATSEQFHPDSPRQLTGTIKFAAFGELGTSFTSSSYSTEILRLPQDPLRRPVQNWRVKSLETNVDQWQPRLISSNSGNSEQPQVVPVNLRGQIWLRQSARYVAQSDLEFCQYMLKVA